MFLARVCCITKVSIQELDSGRQKYAIRNNAIPCFGHKNVKLECDIIGANVNRFTGALARICSNELSAHATLRSERKAWYITMEMYPFVLPVGSNGYGI